MEFHQPLHVNAPNIGDRRLFHEYVEEMLDQRQLTNHGKRVLQLESELRDYLGVKHCIATCNGTIALEIAARALDLSGEVILPSLTFVATAHALQWQEITPVFCDVDPVSLCIDPRQVERHITPRTTGIIGVHVYGRGCDTEALAAVAESNGLKLMYDAAHAFGNTINGMRIGCFGDCEVFSFHATKFFNTFEGGAIATNNDALAEKARLTQNFGFSDFDRVDCVGINGKMTEVCAAMGLVNLRSIEEFKEVNRQNYRAYAKGVEGIRGLRLLQDQEKGSREENKSNEQYILVEVGDDFPLSRDGLMERLHGENVLVRRYFWPGCHRMEPYKTQWPDAALPVTEAFLERVLLFPSGTAINPDIIDRILALVKSWIG